MGNRGLGALGLHPQRDRADAALGIGDQEMLARLGQEAVGRDPAAHGGPLAGEPALQPALGNGLDRDRIADGAIGQMLEHGGLLPGLG